HDAAGAAVSEHSELVGADHDGVLRRQRGNRPRLSHDADRACRVGHLGRRLRRIHQPRRGLDHHGAPEAEPQQHGGAGGGHRAAALNLAAGDVHAALQRNNYLAAVGQTKGDLVQVNLLANTDLRTTDEFKNLVVAERNGAIVRLSDVARVELGAEEADFITKFSDKEAVYMGVWPLPGSNEIEVANRLHAEMARIRPTLPSDIDMQMAYDATVFMTDALQEISKTLVETILIVGLVVFLFMGSIRTALVPLVAMPVSLVGAAIVMYAFGFSLNLLTILAIVLSVGLVVDDAIVVVENVERHVREGKTRIQAALVGARELVGPIIAMTITLAAVYTPIGFQGGL